MNKFNAVTIRNISTALSVWITLSSILLLIARFMQNYTGICIRYFILCLFNIFTRAYVRKRVVNRNIHDRKFALFTRGTGHGPIT
jgi:hypothetical protein